MTTDSPGNRPGSVRGHPRRRACCFATYEPRYETISVCRTIIYIFPLCNALIAEIVLQDRYRYLLRRFVTQVDLLVVQTRQLRGQSFFEHWILQEPEKLRSLLSQKIHWLYQSNQACTIFRVKLRIAVIIRQNHGCGRAGNNYTRCVCILEHQRHRVSLYSRFLFSLQLRSHTNNIYTMCTCYHPASKVCYHKTIELWPPQELYI